MLLGLGVRFLLGITFFLVFSAFRFRVQGSFWFTWVEGLGFKRVTCLEC